MRKTIIVLITALSLAAGLQAQQPEKKGLRIVDSLSAQEKANRQDVILRSELDSLIRQFNESKVVEPVQEPLKESSMDLSVLILAALGLLLLGVGILAGLFYRHQKRVNRAIAGMGTTAAFTDKQLRDAALAARSGKIKTGNGPVETRINELTDELNKLTRENEGMQRVIHEYNGIQHEFDSLKLGLTKAYKVKNYPGYDKTKAESMAWQGVLDTEASLAGYAYEKFLKPILRITDANKNHPAKLSPEDAAKLTDALISLSLLYIEYLYLRVKDLSIGGKMVERIHHFSNGKGPDLSLLKKLDTEFGSRALVLRVALDKLQLRELSYPVFDETNLNPR